eukprot:GFUD01018852.1.p1 GENE.GFUD01018852.1~~GFUD01018852.1.p1  ORF type:complete len:408 (-),score=75.56 GFUD01018852.1:170-1393(-)
MSLLTITLVFVVNLFSLANSAKSTNETCTEEMRALATLKFQVCKTELFYYCDRIEDMMDIIGYYEGEYLKESDPENFQADNPCSGHNTSCGYLEFLVDVCGAQYGVCHGEEERREIMRMWIKQFVRETVRKANRHEDNSTEIKTGQCNHRLSEFFNLEEVDEITDFVEDAYKRKFETNEINYLLINYRSNISTHDFGVLLDKDRKEIGSQYSNDYSSWIYCTWKLTKDLMFNFKKLEYQTLNNFLNCDGKCNTLTLPEDSDELRYEKISKVSKGLDDTFGCFHSVGWSLTSVDFTDLHNGRMGLCNSFQTLIHNCSIPVGRCLGNVAIREVVTAKLLQGLLSETKDAISFVQKHYEDPSYFGDFNFEDCEIFGGNGATAAFASSNWILILTLMTCGYVKHTVDVARS